MPPYTTLTSKITEIFEQFWRSLLQVIYTILQLKFMEKITVHGTKELSVNK